MFSLFVSRWSSHLHPSSGILKSFAFFALWVTLWLPIAIPIARHLKWHPPHPLDPQQKLSLLMPLYLLVPLLLGAIVWIEKQPISNYGLGLDRSVFVSLMAGLALSILTLFIAYGLQVVWGTLAWQPEAIAASFLPTLGSILALSLWIGVIEETVFRGFLLTELQGDMGLVWAAILSSLIFALSHLIWDFKGSLIQVPGLALMGLVLVLARWVDGGSLGLAWGLHGGWIWGLISLDTTQILKPKSDRSWPEWVTGINGEPLSGLVGILILGITGLILGLMGHFGS
ncbi:MULTISPECIES: CPBP family intramembrane glutamic endopeptidase [unclassified Roseofilum]|uniref:CPBP family intramembrane glutamic endopeptidase n=1 Tax=unclassified Roseofilum TaxID=2620099 RepID=UPI001B15B9B3|nr:MULTISPECIES: CPBP family intramembrane glutamic endopeptidase [unclassified Roseofilum]MBP0009459.1 CPBP family intramembrane metalloprotease [Roseofilum sp. Belize Diploria]MBP0033926.1 CPBP family intramembrane metalloprotease [Roseofilum sp. Belize BBD 4]